MGIQQMCLFRTNACAKITLAAVFITLIALFLRIQNSVNSPTHRAGNGFFVQDRLGAPETKEEEMNARTQHMRRFCSQFPKRRHISLNLNGTFMYISEKYRLSYCRVAKVGSTFWTQAFLLLSGVSTYQGAHAQKYNSIFDVPRDESHQALEQHEELTMSLYDSRINSTTSFLVARNPFSRLFSSYIDQIYMPNKWNIGQRMIDTNHKKFKQQICPNEVTFEDFLKYVSQKVLVGTDVGLHWAPIFSICEPCSIKVDVLAKQETFNEDVEYILNLVGVDQTNKDEIYNVLKETNKESLIAGLIHTYVTKAYLRKRVRKECISENALAERLWSAFQIQGLIHNDVPFPETKFHGTTEDQTEDNLKKLVLEAIKQRSLTSAEKDVQRQQWKVHFWQQISLDTLKKVQDAYFEDFMTFGYELDPNTM